MAAAPVPTPTLTPSARRGYGLGSVATGSFGTVPGLLLLPYLTDRLGIAAGLAGLVVFLPKAWDVLLNPVAGRISDRSTNPAGRRRPFLIRSGSACSPSPSSCSSPDPTSPTGLATAWVVVLFLACATAYAFFQVPYVAMPAEMTDDYDERTRLMTWRVAILALAILVSGGLSPRDPRRARPGVGLPRRRPLRGRRSSSSARSGRGGAPGTPRCPARRRPAAACATSCASWRHPASSARCSASSSSRRSRPARCSRASTTSRGCSSAVGGRRDRALRLLRRAGARRHPAVAARAARRAASASATSGARCSSSAEPLATLLTVRIGLAATALSVAVVGTATRPARCSRSRCCPTSRPPTPRRTGEDRAGTYTGVWTAGETLGLALGPFLYAGVLALGGYVSSTDAAAAQPDSAQNAIAWGFTVVPAVLVAVSLLVLRRLPARRGGGADDRAHDGPTRCSPPCEALQADRPPGPRRPHPRLRLRLGARRRRCRRPRGARDVRRRRTGSTPPPSPRSPRMENDLVAMTGGLLDAPDRVRRVGHLRGHRVDPARRPRGPEGRRPPEPEHGAAHLGARRVPQGRGVPRGPRGARRRRPPHAARRSRRDGRRRRRLDRPRRRLGPVVRPRRRRPGARDRRPRRRARHPLPRRRVHRRLGAAAPRRRAARGPSPSRASRASASTCTSTPTPPRASRCSLHRSAALRRAPPLRLGGLARLHDAQQHDAVDALRRAARRGVGRHPPDRPRGLRPPRPSRPARRPSPSRPRPTASPASGSWRRPTRPSSPSPPTTRATSSRSPTRCSSAGGSSSPRCPSATCRRPCTSPCRPPPRPSVPELVVALSRCRGGGPRGRSRRRRPRSGGARRRHRPRRRSTTQGFAGCSLRPASPAATARLALPERMAPVNALLDACPPALREALLLGVLDRLSRPTPA